MRVRTSIVRYKYETIVFSFGTGKSLGNSALIHQFTNIKVRVIVEIRRRETSQDDEHSIFDQVPGCFRLVRCVERFCSADGTNKIRVDSSFAISLLAERL